MHVFWNYVTALYLKYTCRCMYLEFHSMCMDRILHARAKNYVCNIQALSRYITLYVVRVLLHVHG